MRDPLIVDVKRGSHHDGPGLRSVVFFKGCPLRCVFCQNPETHETHVQIAFSPQRCIQCARCEEVCPEDAASLEAPGRVCRTACTRCGACTEVCPDGALRRVGRHYTPGALAELVLRDRAFYERSGGGVTLSGGEPTLFPAYLESFLGILKAEGLHVVLQTCGYFHYEAFRRRILPYVDLVYYDVKLADPKAHRRYTGRSNDRILANLRRLLREDGVVVEPRLPLVPGITATADNLAAVVDLLCDMGARFLQLLPYNPLGLDMWTALGRPRPSVPDRFMTQEEERQTYETFQEILRSKAVQL